jgi:hypothetical protein
MPPKKKRAPPKKRKYTQKQKQKQKQSVNVKVSTGGGGGGTSFIPMPTSSTPQFDVNQLLQGLGAIRPPPTVPAPIAEAVKQPIASRASPFIVRETRPNIGGISRGTDIEEQYLMPTVRTSETLSMGPPTGGFSQPRGRVSFFGGESSAASESEPEIESSSSKKKGRPIGSKNKPKPVFASVVSAEPMSFSSSSARSVPSYFESDIPSEVESRSSAQAAFERLKAQKERNLGMSFAE